MDPSSREMERMLRAIDSDFALTGSQTGLERLSDPVREALSRVPRHVFVPGELRRRAYENNALPIGGGQTISQPFIVALMTDLLRPGKDGEILEIGTGSGYQTAVLAELARQVYSVEVRPDLALKAQELLRTLGYGNVDIRTGDGHAGWPEHAPFDGILVTAAAREVPESLVEQLKPGGRMVLPVGPPYQHQELVVVRKGSDGKISSRAVLGVAFVPFIQPETES